MESQALRCARYARISLDRAGDEHGVANQLADQQRAADARGFVIVRTEVDNDISALNGKHRPGYEAVMAAAARGEIDVILVFQTSRFWRNRRERAEGIEILRQAGVSLIATKGPSLDMSTAYGRGMASLLGEFDTMESEVKAERQQLAAFHRAENGQPPAGVRLTGYTMAGVVVESEAAAVRQMFTRFHAGDSLRGIVAWLTEQAVPTRSGRPWNPSSVRGILTNPRYAGRVVYRGQYPGELDGKMGAWPPLVEEWLFDSVQATLCDPRRRKQVGTHRKHLGSGLYLCGICDHPVWANTSTQPARQQLRYWCPEGGHVTRSAAPVDDLVLRLVRARLAKPDLRNLLAKPTSKEARQAAEEIRRLRGRLEQTRLDYDNDLIDGARYKAKTAKLQAQLDATEVTQARLMAGSEVAGTLTASDPVAAFDQAPLGAQRAVIAFLMTVRLDPAPRGRHFSPESVRIDWREHRGTG
jgi:site-specific DNA recombinase